MPSRRRAAALNISGVKILQNRVAKTVSRHQLGQPHQEFGISVSDDTVYRTLKDLGFSHVSARPRAYKQNAEAMEAFKKTSPPAWQMSARNSRPAHR
jgi:transposase